MVEVAVREELLTPVDTQRRVSSAQMLPAGAWGAPTPSAACPLHPGLCPPRGARGRPQRPPLHQQLLLSCPRVSQPTNFPLPGASSWQSALGQACLLSRLPVCPSLFFVSFLLLNVLAYLTWLWVGMSMGVCV